MPEPLPKGTRLLHIGPAKTGTTSLQSAFHRGRKVALEHGVLYAGRHQQAWYAAQAALALSRDVRPRRKADWPALVAEVNDSDADRVVISSEAFAHADEFAIDAIVEAFGRDRTHVVITMRPLGDMLSSSWWQYVQGGSVKPYDEWLQGVLRDDLEGTSIARGFWRRSRIDVLAERWASRIGPENVTVISLADRPRDFVIRTFEELTALPTGLLVSKEAGSNKTMPFPIAELARQFNEVALSQRALGKRRTHLSRMTAYNALKRHADLLTDQTRIDTPAWAVEEAGAIVGRMNDRIRELGVNVIGDLDALARPARSAPETVAPAPTTIPIGDAATLAYFMMVGADRRAVMITTERMRKRNANRAKRAKRQLRRARRQRKPENLSGRELVRLLGKRVKRRLRRP